VQKNALCICNKNTSIFPVKQIFSPLMRLLSPNKNKQWKVNLYSDEKPKRNVTKKNQTMMQEQNHFFRIIFRLIRYLHTTLWLEINLVDRIISYCTYFLPSAQLSFDNCTISPKSTSGKYFDVSIT
jgi:hypothetical protein